MSEVNEATPHMTRCEQGDLDLMLPDSKHSGLCSESGTTKHTFSALTTSWTIHAVKQP